MRNTLCSFFERLAGPFWTQVDSLDSFQRFADSDKLTFSLSVAFPAVDIVNF